MVTIEQLEAYAAAHPPYPARHRRPRVRWTEQARVLGVVLGTLAVFALVCSAALIGGAR
jgi:hypothetical protein